MGDGMPHLLLAHYNINLPGHLGGSVSLASDFSSGHDLTICEFKPMLSSVLTSQSLERALDSVSPSLSAPRLLVLSLSLSLYLSLFQK